MNNDYDNLKALKSRATRYIVTKITNGTEARAPQWRGRDLALLAQNDTMCIWGRQSRRGGTYAVESSTADEVTTLKRIGAHIYDDSYAGGVCWEF